LRNIYRVIALGGVNAALLLPQVNKALSITMVNKALVEPALLLGYFASTLIPLRASKTLAPAGLAAGTFLIVLWMIPHSIDMTQIYAEANAGYVISLFVAGYLLATCLPAVPGVGVVIYALYMASMVVAVGVLYVFQTTLWCSAYTIDDQIDFGWSLTIVGVIAYVIILFSIPALFDDRRLDAAGHSVLGRG
jgi:hypothetical protein